MEKSLRPGWASGNVYVDGHDVIDPSERGIVFAKDAAADSASTHRDDYLGIGHRSIGFQQGELHVPSDRPGDEEHVGVTRRGNKLNAEAFQVVNRTVQSDDFEFASVARTGIDLSDGKG